MSNDAADIQATKRRNKRNKEIERKQSAEEVNERDDDRIDGKVPR